MNTTADGYIPANQDSRQGWVPKYIFYTWEQVKTAPIGMIDPILAEFQREKTMILKRASTPALTRMPTGLDFIADMPDADM